MKKFLAILLALAMILALAACGAKTEAPVVAPTEPAAPSEPTEPAAPSIAPGTSWNAVEGYHREEDPTSVWQYYFFDPQDSSYNLMMQFLDHEDINIHSWYPWEGSWVGIGFNDGEFCEVKG
jgi:predicted small lipoprotein YifL